LPAAALSLSPSSLSEHHVTHPASISLHEPSTTRITYSSGFGNHLHAVSFTSTSLALAEPHNEAMPHRLDTHVLTVDPNVIHKVDTANLAHLSSIWTGE
jgi:hypothetical protein